MNEGTALILARCQTFTNTLLISKPFYLAPPNTLKYCTPLASSKHKVIGLVISANNNNGQSKHLCRVPPSPRFKLFFFFFFRLGRFYSHIYTSSVSSLNFRVDLNFIITRSWHLRYAVLERRILGTKADTAAMFLVSLGL